MNPDSFNIYYLIPIPNFNNKIIIPIKNYIIINKFSYAYLNEPCRAINDIKICTSHLHLTAVDNDCVVNIVLEEKSMNCNLIPSSYRGLDLYVEEISNSFYFIYTLINQFM